MREHAQDIDVLDFLLKREMRSLVDQLIKTTGTATGQLLALGRANAAVSDAAGRPWLDPIGTPVGPLTPVLLSSSDAFWLVRFNAVVGAALPP